jgi:hypothetical protein
MDFKSLTDRPTIVELFGIDGDILLDVSRKLVRELDHAPIRYSFMSEEDYKDLLSTNLAEANAVYVRELLYRAHLAAVTSLIRALRWSEGCLVAYQSGLFLPFTASCRGLLESVSDAGYSIARMPYSFAEHFQAFQMALRGNFKESLVVAKSIEDPLVHFTEGRRLDRSEKSIFPIEFRAKQPSDYIAETLEKYEPYGFYEWYSELCEYAHPAGNSVGYLLRQREEDRNLELLPSSDSLHFDKFLLNHKSRLNTVLRYQLQISLITLKVLAQYSISELRSNVVGALDLSEYELWRKCAQVLNLRPHVATSRRG